MSINAPWAPLIPAAMIGTDRQATPLPSWPGEVGGLIAGAPEGEASRRVLHAAAVLATCGLAGARGLPWAGTLAPAAADDTAPEIDAALSCTVAWALAEGPNRLHHDLCVTLARSGHRLPAHLLPQALEVARRSLPLRRLMWPVLGERGLWLAARNDAWRFAAGVSEEASAETVWTDGSLDQRRAFLAAERQRDPAAARERLLQGLASLGAKERADLAGALSEGLGAGDEPLLDTLRADRSREVRQVALGLFLRLPSAAHSVRATARLGALLQQERALLQKRWTIEAPTEADPAWKADQVEGVCPANESLGERAWWLYQIVRQAPLGWWTAHTGRTAAELLRWAHGTDWGEALVRGWRDVLMATHDAEWCEAFLADWPHKVLRDDPMAVMALLPLAAREVHWQRRLREGGVGFDQVAEQAVAACPAGESLSADLSQLLAQEVRQRFAAGTLSSDYRLRTLAPELCCVLHPDALALLANLPPSADDTPAQNTARHTLAQVGAVRRALLSISTPRTP